MKQSTLLRRQVFISCGLSDKEALLYDILLAKGQASASELEKESKLKKNTYALLKSLVKKHLALPIRGNGLYQASPPDVLEQLAKEQEKGVKNTLNTLSQILPGLSSEYAMAVGKPPVRYYEGEEGLREVFADIYAPKNTPIYGCVDLEKADTVFPEYIAKTLIPLRVRNKVVAYSFVGNSQAGYRVKERDKQELRHTTIIDKSAYPVPAEIDVYEDKIAFLSFEKGKFIGMIVENSVFAASLQSIFKIAFSKGSEPKTDEDPKLFPKQASNASVPTR